MNRILYITLLSLLLIAGCKNDNQNELAQLQKEYNQLKEQTAEKDTTLNQLFSSMNEIEQNLQLITQKEKSIILNLKNGIENKKSQQEQIINEIQFINSLIDKNKQSLNNLTSSLSERNYKIVELTKMIETLTNKLNKKDEQLIALKNKLIKLNFKIDALNISLDSLTMWSEIQQQMIESQEDELNTVYYCFGTTKELKNNGVITMEGGVVGLGKTEKLSKDLNLNFFKKIDLRQTHSIPLAAKKAKVITSHPTESYKLIGDKTIEKILIKDQDAFWKNSNYLVIVVE